MIGRQEHFNSFFKKKVRNLCVYLNTNGNKTAQFHFVGIISHTPTLHSDFFFLVFKQCHVLKKKLEQDTNCNRVDFFFLPRKSNK